MKTKISILITIFSLGLLFNSCEDELDIPQKGNLGSEENFYKTDEDALAAITCCYYDLLSNFGNIMIVSNTLSDDVWCGGASKGDNSDYENLSAYLHTSANGSISGLFSGLYTMIYEANLVIEKFDEFDTDAKKQAKAEAYFFRGFAHFYLGAFFGTAPVVDHLLPPSEYAKGNSTQEELFQQAVSDFNAAINEGALAIKSGANEPLVRITREAAYAYMGKTYIFMEDWTNAVTALDQVINSGKYELYQGNFEDMLRTVSDFNSESILEVNQVYDVASIDWDFTKFFDNNSINIYNIFHGWRSDKHNWTGQIAEYDDIASDGYGFMNPRKSLYDVFVAIEGVDGYRLNQTIKTAQQVEAMGIVVASGSTLHGHEGYYNWKNRYLKSEKLVEFGFDVFTDNNLRYMRYAEVLLLAAEANLMAGNAAKAAQYYNEIRTRAQLDTKSPVSLDDIKIEKRLELCEEGCRFLDLVRWGDAATVLKDQGKQVMGFNGTSAVVEYTNNTSQGFVAGKHELLPIPEQEMLLNKNIVQNPGW